MLFVQIRGRVVLGTQWVGIYVVLVCMCFNDYKLRMMPAQCLDLLSSKKSRVIVLFITESGGRRVGENKALTAKKAR